MPGGRWLSPDLSADSVLLPFILLTLVVILPMEQTGSRAERRYSIFTMAIRQSRLLRCLGRTSWRSQHGEPM